VHASLPQRQSGRGTRCFLPDPPSPIFLAALSMCDCLFGCAVAALCVLNDAQWELPICPNSPCSRSCCNGFVRSICSSAGFTVRQTRSFSCAHQPDSCSARRVTLTKVHCWFRGVGHAGYLFGGPGSWTWTLHTQTAECRVEHSSGRLPTAAVQRTQHRPNPAQGSGGAATLLRLGCRCSSRAWRARCSARCSPTLMSPNAPSSTTHASVGVKKARPAAGVLPVRSSADTSKAEPGASVTALQACTCVRAWRGVCKLLLACCSKKGQWLAVQC